METAPGTPSPRLRVTASFGVAGNSEADDSDTLLAAADARLRRQARRLQRYFRRVIDTGSSVIATSFGVSDLWDLRRQPPQASKMWSGGKPLHMISSLQAPHPSGLIRPVRNKSEYVL